MNNKKSLNKFLNIFSSMWKTAKSRGITKKDVAKEIKAHRNN